MNVQSQPFVLKWEAQLRSPITHSAIQQLQPETTGQLAPDVNITLAVTETKGGHIALYGMVGSRLTFMRSFYAVVKGSYPGALYINGNEIFVLFRLFCGVFTLDGSLLRVFKSNAREVNVSLVIIENNIFIIDRNGWIQKYDLNGNILKAYGPYFNDSFVLNYICGVKPTGTTNQKENEYCNGFMICTGNRGDIVVLDEHLNRVLGGSRQVSYMFDMTIMLPNKNLVAVGKCQPGFFQINSEGIIIHGSADRLTHQQLSFLSIHAIEIHGNKNPSLVTFDQNAKMYVFDIQ